MKNIFIDPAVRIRNGEAIDLLAHFAALLCTVKQRDDHATELFARDVLFLNDKGAAARSDDLRVFELLVVCDIGRRNEDRRLLHQCKLGHRVGARAADHHIRRRHFQRHVVDVFNKLNVLTLIEPAILIDPGGNLPFD